MKHLLSRASAVALVVAAALTAACSNNDPMAPRAASAARTPAAGPVRSSGYAVSWGRDSSSNGSSNGTSSSGYAVSWGKDGGKGGNPSNPDGTMSSGYAVSWGKDGGPSKPDGQ